MENFAIQVDADGVALVTFDVPGRTMNTLTDSVIAELPLLVEVLAGDLAIKGVVLRSGKRNGFCAGADLGDLAPLAGTRITAPPISAAFRALEKLGKPVAVALEGLALGGGLELALACHYRVASSASSVKLGLPEVSIGLLPGAGGTQRLPRLVGVAKALPLLLEGRSVGSKAAANLGIVDEIAAPDEATAAARRWVLEKGDPVARWDAKGFKVPGGLPYSAGGMQTFVMANAMLRKSTYGNYPAAENILKSVFEGIQLPIDNALRIESRYFVNTYATPQARGMIRTLFLAKQALAKGEGWSKVAAPSRVAVIGAGMMGAGIAYSQAACGIDTVLLDVDEAAAERGKAYSRGLVDKAISKGRMSKESGEALLGRIATSASYDDVETAELVVEAVFENIDLKHDVVRRVEQRIAPDAILGSNTSTLPITSLAEASSRPANFVGIHFFSPVDRMELVEIIRGSQTSEDTIAKAVAYTKALGKTPIVVNDSRGFYTSRCFGTYIYEGLEMLMEGVPPALIDNAGRMTGMPRGPLELADDVALDLIARILEQTWTAQDAIKLHQPRPYEDLVDEMVRQGRKGRKANAGFYDYPADGPKRIWKGLVDLVPSPSSSGDWDIAILKQRLLHRQALEAARCFDEGVVTDPRAADVGAILGWGFAPWTGGPLSYIDGIGIGQFVSQCDALSQIHGDRFAAPEGLRRLASRDEGYYAAAPRVAA